MHLLPFSLPLALLLLLPVYLAECRLDAFNTGPSHQIHPLRRLTGSAGSAVKVENLSCSSWQLAVETNNLRAWNSVPATCESYIGHYLLGHRYREDSSMVTKEAAKYARSVQLVGDGKDVWIFDIDETALSNLPFFSKHGFGVKPANETLFGEWVATGAAPPLPESLKLYKKVLSLGIKVVFLTGRTEEFRDISALNLKRAGYYSWEKLILRKANEVTETALQYKSAERLKLTKQGYNIVGNIGDQWSDILGSPEGGRTFKLPDPLYYIS